MKIIAFGDIHGATLNLMRLSDEIKNADKIVFVGDGADSLDVLDAEAHSKLLAVRGNCDFFCKLPDKVFVDGIFVTHGHNYGVKGSLSALVQAAQSHSAKLCLFGHNHRRSVDTINGIVFINPGTLGNSRTSVPNSYAVIEINGKEVKNEFRSL